MEKELCKYILLMLLQDASGWIVREAGGSCFPVTSPPFHLSARHSFRSIRWFLCQIPPFSLQNSIVTCLSCFQFSLPLHGPSRRLLPLILQRKGQKSDHLLFNFCSSKLQCDCSGGLMKKVKDECCEKKVLWIQVKRTEMHLTLTRRRRRRQRRRLRSQIQLDKLNLQ